jgi:hypothetical protein
VQALKAVIEDLKLVIKEAPRGGRFLDRISLGSVGAFEFERSAHQTHSGDPYRTPAACSDQTLRAVAVDDDRHDQSASRSITAARAGDRLYQRCGLIVSADPLFTNLRDQIVALSARHRIPAIYIWSEFVSAGGLMSYGSDIADSYRLAGFSTGKILNGASPADLPVEQAAHPKCG